VQDSKRFASTPRRGACITHRVSPERPAESEKYRADFGTNANFDESARARVAARAVRVSGALAILLYWQFAPRPEGFGLAPIVDGPAPGGAAGVVVNCPVGESRSLANALRSANKPVRDIEYDGKHEMPRDVI
jgi:hypothetical protein